jgi:hypothetical protein
VLLSCFISEDKKLLSQDIEQVAYVAMNQCSDI